MLIDLPILWIVVLDILGWFIIHMSAAYLMTQLPTHLFDPTTWLFKPRGWEGDGAIYQRSFRIKQWKESLPDGATLFQKGFKKKRLVKRDRDYFEQFISETCRGELTHWIVLGCSPIFFLWNYWWVGIIMIIYALAANFPCILAQRYNRIRFRRLIKKHQQPNSPGSIR